MAGPGQCSDEPVMFSGMTMPCRVIQFIRYLVSWCSGRSHTLNYLENR